MNSGLPDLHHRQRMFFSSYTGKLSAMSETVQFSTLHWVTLSFAKT